MKAKQVFSDSPGTSRLMIFGHPSHELALFGAIQRLRPHIVVMTDGGGAEREGYSRTALETIGALDRTRYLSLAESDFYRALLDGDVRYFEGVIARLAECIETTNPDQVFCDAVEFYNSVHDITLPLVRAALGSDARRTVCEVPLVYQKDCDGEVYEIQRVPEALAHRRVALELTEAECDRKQHARDEIYLNLRDQAGGDFLGLPRSHLAREEVALATSDPTAPNTAGRRLRYERRARLLKNQGLIEREITYSDHYLPMVRRLLVA